MQIRSLSLKLLTPFNSIKLFQFMVTIETQGAFDCMRNPDLSLKSGFQIWQSNAKCKTDISPSPPRNPSSNHDFMDFLYTVLVGKTVLVNSVFFSACYACACEITVLSKTVQIFSCYIPEILITKGQISPVQQPHRPATPYDIEQAFKCNFFVWSIDTNVFSMNFKLADLQTSVKQDYITATMMHTAPTPSIPSRVLAKQDILGMASTTVQVT